MPVTPALRATVPRCRAANADEHARRTGSFMVVTSDRWATGAAAVMVNAGHHHDRPRATPARRAWTG
jgi:hypothetical protein